MKFLSTEILPEIVMKKFQSCGFVVDVLPNATASQLGAVIDNYQGILVGSSAVLTDENLRKASHLLIIGYIGFEMRNINIKLASLLGIIVFNAPDGNDITSAEHTLGMIIASARHITAANKSVHEGKWERKNFIGIELFGKTLGLIGCGDVGSIVAKLAIALGMKVIIHDPFVMAEEAQKLGVLKTNLDELYSRADIISLHLPINNYTYHILNAKAFAKMKHGVRVINCSRSGLVDEKALAEAIICGKVASCALDTLEIMPIEKNPMHNMSNVIITPHLLSSTIEAKAKTCEIVCNNIINFFKNGEIINAVNMPTIKAEYLKYIKPYMQLCYRTGDFLRQITKSKITHLVIEYEGKITKYPTTPLTQMILFGILQDNSKNNNFVNMFYVMKNKAIQYTEIIHDIKSRYVNLVTLTAEFESGYNFKISTTISPSEIIKTKIVSLNDTIIEAIIEDNFIFNVHKNKIGFVGEMGKILSDVGINITSFNLTKSRNDDLFCIIAGVDKEIDQSIIDKIDNIDQSITTYFVQLRNYAE